MKKENIFLLPFYSFPHEEGKWFVVTDDEGVPIELLLIASKRAANTLKKLTKENVVPETVISLLEQGFVIYYSGSPLIGKSQKDVYEKMSIGREQIQEDFGTKVNFDFLTVRSVYDLSTLDIE